MFIIVFVKENRIIFFLNEIFILVCLFFFLWKKILRNIIVIKMLKYFYLCLILICIKY